MKFLVAAASAPFAQSRGHRVLVFAQGYYGTASLYNLETGTVLGQAFGNLELCKQALSGM